MKNFTVGKKIIAGFTLILVITVALGMYARSRLVAISDISHSITEDSLPGVCQMSAARGHVKDNAIILHSMLTAANASELSDLKNQLKDGRSKVAQTFDEYAKTIFQAQDRECFDAIKAPREAYIETTNAYEAAIDAGKHDEALALWKSRVVPGYQAYTAAINKLADYNKDSGAASAENIKALLAQSEWGLCIAVLLALAFGGLAAFVITRGVNGSLNAIAMTLRSSAEQVAAAATQVAQSSQSMASGASEQASSLEETSASLEEMASMTRQNADNARAARAVSDEASSAAESGQSTTRKMGSEINYRIDGMNTAIQKIKTSADQTAKIVKTIDEIAFQTNLLALNAAVEAARAGEAGKGFANTVEAANKVKQLIGEVAAASGEQSKGVEQINTAVSEMDKVTQSNAANAEESASASEELSAQSRELQDMVNALIKLIRGGGETMTQPAAARAEKAPARSDRTYTTATPKAVRKASASSQPKPAKTPINRVAAHVNGTNGSAKPSQVIPLSDEELSGF